MLGDFIYVDLIASHTVTVGSAVPPGCHRKVTDAFKDRLTMNITLSDFFAVT